MEYAGDGVATLTVPERATITNMGAELGATTSVFPSDEVTRAFLKAQDREADWQPLAADPGRGLRRDRRDLTWIRSWSPGGHAPHAR